MLNLINSVLKPYNLEIIKNPDKKCAICGRHFFSEDMLLDARKLWSAEITIYRTNRVGKVM